MSLISLVYVSVQSRPLSEDDLKDILASARDHNPDHDITGMLLYREGFFIQALEGEEEAVMELYNKIQQDDRHRNILTVHKAEVDERSFGSWAMGFNKFGHEELVELEGYEDYDDLDDFFTENPSHAQRLLESFRNKTYF